MVKLLYVYSPTPLIPRLLHKIGETPYLLLLAPHLAEALLVPRLSCLSLYNSVMLYSSQNFVPRMTKVTPLRPELSPTHSVGDRQLSVVERAKSFSDKHTE